VDTVRLDDGLYRTRTPNGLTVLSEKLPGVRSVAMGIWVQTASAHEDRRRMGVSHMLEHMVFKGTERRTAKQLALELEIRGGSLDAYTSRDHTSYQAHVLDADLPVAVDILTDLVRRPLLREADLATERNVVLEEIHGVLDTPDDLVFELHASTMWPEHPYGFSILGTSETVAALTAADLKALHEADYYPGNCVIAAAGNVEHEALLGMLDHEGWFDGQLAVPSREPVEPVAAVQGVKRIESRDTTQAHIVIGSESFPYADPRRYALSMLTNAFGGGMSSRLFQRIREDLGLAYAIFAFQQLYRSTGQIGVYLGTKPATATEAIEAILSEFTTIAREGLPSDEVADSKRQLKGHIMLALENASSRMNRLASVALHGDRYLPMDDILATIDAVTTEEVAAVSRELFAPERQTIVILGPPGAGNGLEAPHP
jgi:predicted Zn-dependent peptidase